MGDTSILITIVIIFVFLGALLPFVHAAFGQPETDLNVGNIPFQSGDEFTEDDITVTGVIGSIFLMFFWTFGAIPALLDLLVFVPLRIGFVYLLFRAIRGI